ncbi:hypothetical protein M409DRAFT_56700 [Zasmidium cellare ATCC 36951]|uniref:NmrA-like domain-containing protein n=1 Tax=Zasmidium cellare ATCC 36951 TaxID=1080233 RepID=A0A6A6CG92_ZASCE|nr:uncharacterized protein M409DRAFT_56700 [Zasmidium cellare ATCC 36951]KAF2164436.1 hypothetical protein M409DRAFT_56700 [Zasmidium cellare ATCC 36951]
MPIDFDNDLILITAASGRQASGLLPRLASKAKHLRLQCVSDSSRQRLEKEYPQAEVIQTTFASIDNAKKLLHNVSVCFLVSPAFELRETQCGINMIDAARENARNGGPFKHMIHSSVIHPCLRALTHHDAKRLIEEALVESKLPYTILQPTHQMDVVPIKLLVQQEEIVFKARFNPSTKMSFVNCHDLGEAVFNIINDLDSHQYATYQLISTRTPLDYHEAMAEVSKVVGKKVRVEEMTLDETIKDFRSSLPKSMSEVEREAVVASWARMIVHYQEHGLLGNYNSLKMLLGREPLGYREWVEMQLKS